MTYKTHFVGGICAAALTSTIMPVESLAVVTAVSAVFALVPDLDIEDSKLGRKAGLVSKGISRAFGHRGFFHTPILYIALYFLMSMALPTSICLGFLIGTMSHLVLDSFNYKGIMWFYPLTKKHFHIASVKTRGFGETMFLILMVALSVYAFVKVGVATEPIRFDGVEIKTYAETFFEEIKVISGNFIEDVKVYFN